MFQRAELADPNAVGGGSGQQVGALDLVAVELDQDGVAFGRGVPDQRLRREEEKLEGQLYLLTVRKRAEAGLEHVDRSLEEIEEIEAGTLAYREALTALDQVRNQLCALPGGCDGQLKSKW